MHKPVERIQEKQLNLVQKRERRLTPKNKNMNNDRFTVNNFFSALKKILFSEPMKFIAQNKTWANSNKDELQSTMWRPHMPEAPSAPQQQSTRLSVVKQNKIHNSR